MPQTAGLKQETFMFHSSEVWKSEIRVLAWSGSGKSCIPGFFEWKRKREKNKFSPVSHYKGTNPFVGLLRWLSSKEPACQCRRPGFNPGMGGSLEREMATHSSTLAWEIAWTEEPGWTTAPGVAKSQTWLSDWASISCYEAPPFWPKTSQKPCLHTSSHWGLGIWYRNLPRGYNIHSIRIILWVNCNYGWRVLFF